MFINPQEVVDHIESSEDDFRQVIRDIEVAIFREALSRTQIIKARASDILG